MHLWKNIIVTKKNTLIMKSTVRKHIAPATMTIAAERMGTAT